MRIICDTNILVSGFLFAGNCRTIISLVSKGQVDGFISVALVEELEDVLLRPKFGLTAHQVEAIVDLVRQTFPSVSPVDVVNVISADPEDNTVLEAAVAAKADMIISGDEHLLALGTFREIRIVSPAGFLADLKTK